MIFNPAIVQEAGGAKTATVTFGITAKGGCSYYYTDENGQAQVLESSDVTQVLVQTNTILGLHYNRSTAMDNFSGSYTAIYNDVKDGWFFARIDGDCNFSTM